MTLSKLIIALFTLCAATAAQATQVVIEDTRCVKSDIQRTHKSVTDYANYSRLPGARYEMHIPMIGDMPMLTMVKSQSRYTLQTDTATDGVVWVVLQPTNIADARFYPRFLLHCTSSFDSERHFTHLCNLDKSRQHYGLQDFSSTLEVTADSLSCPVGQTQLVYRLVLDSSSSDVDAIKNKAVEPAGPIIGPVVARLFDEEAFFRSYYVNFYSSWAKSLNGN